MEVGYQGQRRATDPNSPNGYGDGYLSIFDTNLDAEASLGVLPFAATENSAALSSALKIATWKRTESGGAVTYELQDVVPRLTLRTGSSLTVVLSHDGQTRDVSTTLSIFSDPLAQLDLDLQRTVLPRYWQGLAATLRDARFVKERYRLTALDIAQLDYTRPIWDGVLQGYYAVSKVSEFSPGRPTEIELARLHPAFLIAPSADATTGAEFYEGEFYTGPAAEFY